MRTAPRTVITGLIAMAALVYGFHAPVAVAQQAVDTTMVPVPAGDFWMGRTRLWLMDEINWQIRERMDDRPVHRVSLDAFAMDVHETTNAEYAAFVQATGAAAPYHWGGTTPAAEKASLPVYNVSWHEAAAYCAWLGKRLPTEAEWEKAARGGVADLDYPWGNDYETEGPPSAPPATRSSGAPQTAPVSTSGDGDEATPAPASRPVRVKHAHNASASGPRAVGSYEANGYGLYDMSGNVWEWVGDWYDLYYYGVSPIQNPTGPREGLYKVIRGGSWADNDVRLGAVYFRNFALPDEQSPTIGFRCAR